MSKLHTLCNRDIKPFLNEYLDLCKKHNVYFGLDMVVYELPTINIIERLIILAKLVRKIKSVNEGVNHIGDTRNSS